MPKSFKIDAKEMVSLSIYFVIVVWLTSWLMPLTFKIKGWDDQPMFFISMGIGAVLFSLLIDYAFSWAKTDKTETQPSKAVTQAHDEFESSIDEIKRKRDSRVNMNFATTPSGVYQDLRTRRAFAHFNTSPAHERSSDDFLLSLMVGYATDSPIMGYAAGGSLLGGMVGAGMHDNDNSSFHHVSTSHDYSPRVETPETMLVAHLSVIAIHAERLITRLALAILVQVQAQVIHRQTRVRRLRILAHQTHRQATN
jgi:hypothetical protein